jgi:hypothetical protein
MLPKRLWANKEKQYICELSVLRSKTKCVKQLFNGSEN